jgi:glutamate dehydrogenase
VSVAVTDRMTLDLRRLIDRAGRWLLNYRPQPLAVGAEINRFAEKVRALTPQMSEWLRGDDKIICEKEAREFNEQGVSADLAYMVSTGLYQYSLLDVIDIADIVDRDPAEVADTYFALMERLGTDGLLTAVSRAQRTLTEIYESGELDLATLSVAARQLRSMTRTSGTGRAG